MNILLVGGGKLMYFLARSFIAKGHEVTIINRDREEGKWLAKKVNALVVHGEGSDTDILEEAGARKADAVLAVTPNDEDNLVICQLSDLHFGVPRTLALVNDPDNEKIFKDLGVSEVFSTTHILSSLIEQKTDFEEITNLIPVGKGKLNVTEVKLQESSPASGKPLTDIKLPGNALIASIMRNEEPIIPSGTTKLEPRDRLIVVSLPEEQGKVLEMLTGKKA